MHGALRQWHDAMPADMTMLVEYKPFEPAFYHTDIGDWGMAYVFAKDAGENAKVLVDTGHHFQSQNIEQIVAWLIDEGMLGGFHFNDRKYADDDLTIGSIDPYQVFRIFHEILSAPAEASRDVAYMIDQSHNMKHKLEAMVQSVVAAQELFAKAALIDQEQLAQLQSACQLVEAEETFRSAFWTDVRPLVREWREARRLPLDPLRALEESGYIARAAKERGARNRGSVATYA
jgi:L-rhamnose isomerase/sugar isomerase